MKVFQFQDVEGNFHTVMKVRGGRARRAKSTAICGKHTTAMRHVADFEVGDVRGSHHLIRGCEVCVAGVSNMFDLIGGM